MFTFYKICYFNILKGREDMVIAPFKGKNVAKKFEVPNDFTENCVTFHQKIKGKLNILKLIRYILIMKMMQC